MSEQQTKRLADTVVSAINKDFTLVGSHRVHGWYSWALIGIVFGMALGITYVANRTGEFAASQAASFKISVIGNNSINGFIHKIGERNLSFIADAGAVAAATGQTVITGPGLDYSFAGTNFSTLYNFDEANVNAVFINNDRTQAWRGSRSGQKITINTAESPSIDTSRSVDIYFKGIYVDAKGNRKQGVITGTMNASIDMAGTHATTGENRVRMIEPGNHITVPRGMPLYTSGPLTITLENSSKKFSDATFLLPATVRTGTYTLTFRDRNRHGKSDGNVEIIGAEYSPVPNNSPVFGETNEYVFKSGVTRSYTIRATDPDGDALSLSPLDSKSWPKGLTLYSDGSLFWAPPDTQKEYTFTITVRATDGIGGSASKTIRIRVVPFSSSE